MASVVTITNLGEFPVAFMTFLGRFRNLGQILRDLRDLRDHSSVVSVVTAPNSILVTSVASVHTVTFLGGLRNGLRNRGCIFRGLRSRG